LVTVGMAVRAGVRARRRYVVKAAEC